MIKKIHFYLMILLFTANIYAGGETAFPFLKINPDARGNGMAGAVTAEVTSLDSLIWNPSGLAKMISKNMSLNYTRWIGEMNQIYAAYGMPLSSPKYGKIGLSVTYFNQGSLSESVPTTPESLNVDTYDVAVSLGYGVSINKSLQVGAAVRYLNSKILGISQTGAAADAGFQYAVDAKRKLRIGAAIKNLGYSSGNELMPTSIQGGLSYKQSMNADIVRFNVDADYMTSTSIAGARVGLEYTYQKMLLIRAGYKLDSSASTLSRINGFSLGIGTSMASPVPSFKRIAVDATWIPAGELGNSIQLTLNMKN
jgi:hypothetical protein